MSAARNIAHVGRAITAERIVYVALGGDLLIALVKFWAASHTGSAAMFSEGIHSTVDAITEVLLLYGRRASRQPSTRNHPIGFGREIFFWNFIVALLILALGGGVALLDGLRQVMRQAAVADTSVSYAVLASAFAIELFAVGFASSSICVRRGWRGFLAYFRRSRDVTALTVIFGGLSGMMGLVVAALGTWVSTRYAAPVFDGVASIAIAVILTVTAIFLARSSKILLIGVPAAPQTVETLLAIAQAHPAVETANGAVTVHLAPDQILLALSVAFRPGCTTADIEAAVIELDARISQANPDVITFLLKPESAERYSLVEQARGW